MDNLMHWLAPKGATGFVLRLFSLVGVVAVANLLFGSVYPERDLHAPQYYLLHALFVGGPLIAFFLTVTVFQIRLQKRLWRLSRKDGLTGLNNRRTFFTLADAARGEQTGGVLMMLDADWFKNINDTYGHQAGDRCLQAISDTLRQNIRQCDVVGRIGGEEFAIYLRSTDVHQARIIGHRLTRPIPFHVETATQLTITLSIGATVVKNNATLDDLFAAADSALYHAKTMGRATIIFWDETLGARQTKNGAPPLNLGAM